MVCGIYFSEYGFAALFLFVLIVGMYEFNRMSIEPGRHLCAKILTIISGACLFCSVFAWKAFGLSATYILLSFVPMTLGMITSLFEKDKSDYATVANVYTAFVYVAVPLTIANFSVFGGEGYSGILLLCFLTIVWGSDVGAYCLGCTLGKNSKKLFPSISPKKSWWGAAGGMIAAIAIALAFYFTGLFKFGLVHSLVLAVLLDVAAVFGDLVESLWKRSFGVKDSGKLIPGHGGILDRFDSSLFAVPVGTIYLMCFDLI